MSGRSQTVHSEHTAFVNSLVLMTAAEEDGSMMVASAGTDRIIYVWDLTDGRLAYALVGHEDNVCWLDRREYNNSLLISASWDASVRVWAGSECLFKLESVHTAAVWCARAVPGRPNCFLTGKDGGLEIQLSFDSIG